MTEEAKTEEPADLAIIPEYIEAEALVPKIQTGILQALALQGQGKLERYLKEMQGALDVVKTTAIRNSHPFSWTKYRDRDGKVICVPRDQACVEIRKWLGINITNYRPVNSEGTVDPKVTYDDSSGTRVTVVEMWADGESKLTGEAVEQIYYAAKSDDDFIGRKGRTQDLKASCRTGLDAKITRILSGLRKVPEELLQKEGLDTEQCYKGHGYGTSSDRGAAKVTEEGVGTTKKALADEVLSRVGGDVDTARSLMRDITSNPPKFDGFDTAARLTKQWQVDAAWEKLKKHSVFGDHPEPGATDDQDKRGSAPF
jgi:hypothetical protein